MSDTTATEESLSGKTIKQIADEIGVSKTAVRKQIANLGLQSSLRKTGNQFAITSQQETLILQAFSEKTQTKTENQPETKSETENQVSVLVSVLESTINTLREQLIAKDEQIEQLNFRIADLTSALLESQKATQAAQQTAQAAQALHAGTMQARLSDGSERKRGFFARLFGKQDGNQHNSDIDV